LFDNKVQRITRINELIAPRPSKRPQRKGGR